MLQLSFVWQETGEGGEDPDTEVLQLSFVWQETGEGGEIQTLKCYNYHFLAGNRWRRRRSRHWSVTIIICLTGNRRRRRRSRHWSVTIINLSDRKEKEENIETLKCYNYHLSGRKQVKDEKIQTVKCYNYHLSDRKQVKEENIQTLKFTIIIFLTGNRRRRRSRHWSVTIIICLAGNR